MSFSIWTQCAGASELRPLRLEPWRAVEAQHQVSTRKLVDSAAEQELLESLIDGAKPPAAAAARGHRALHYLLTTPFRYPPLRHGSRFGGRFERGLWYGAESLRTAFAEVAYYRLLFLEGTAADLGVIEAALSAFRATIETARGIDLVAPPFDAHRAAISSPTDYSASQVLGAAMREAGAEAFRFPSARTSGAGAAPCVAAFTPEVFRGRPHGFQTWHCTASTERVEFTTRDYFRRETIAFDRIAFLVGDSLPAPAV
jgi:hypothetical protein